jgi:hypothetical protein
MLYRIAESQPGDSNILDSKSSSVLESLWFSSSSILYIQPLSQSRMKWVTIESLSTGLMLVDLHHPCCFIFIWITRARLPHTGEAIDSVFNVGLDPIPPSTHQAIEGKTVVS